VNFPRAVLGLQLLIIIVMMVLRTAPVRVTPNPWFWLRPFYDLRDTWFFRICWARRIADFPDRGEWIRNSVPDDSRVRVAGRNIGFIPAQRKVVTKGAYGLVRHPIYTGTFVSLVAFVLRSYSVLDLTMAVVLIALLMVRGIVEERFLREDAGYAAYLQEVRWRWFPGIA